MKRLFIAAVLLSLATLAFCQQSAEVLTNALLPHDARIWPLPKPADAIVVEAVKDSDKEILRVRQGCWILSEKLITYHVRKVSAGKYPYKSLIFVCQSRRPTPESGIKLKALPWPFRDKGTKTFYLHKDSECKATEYYNIVSYTKD